MNKPLILKNDSSYPVSFSITEESEAIRLDVDSKQSVGLLMGQADAPKTLSVVAHLPSGEQQLESRVTKAGETTWTVSDGVAWQVPAQALQVGASKALTFQIQEQQQTNWCWAAVSSSVNDYYDPHSPPVITQIDLAVGTLHHPQCDARDPGSDACNRPNTLGTGLRFVHRLTASIPGPMAMPAIKQSIDADQPAGAAVVWTGSAVGHALAISAYDDTAGTIVVQDPSPGMGARMPSLAGFPANILGASCTWAQHYTTHA